MEERETARLFTSFRDVPVSISESDTFKMPGGSWGYLDLCVGLLAFGLTVVWTWLNLDNDPLGKLVTGGMVTFVLVWAARKVKKGRPPLVSRFIWMIRRWFPPVIRTSTVRYLDK